MVVLAQFSLCGDAQDKHHISGEDRKKERGPEGGAGAKRGVPGRIFHL